MAENYVIADPIYGLIDFTSTQKELIKPIIDHPYFQRLRHIKQLGLADFVFPGAVHTRFNHCIGTAYIAKRLAINVEIKEENLNKVIISALLHDIGHGPFSHAFEKLVSGKNFKVDHEKWTIEFLKGFKKLNIIKSDYNIDEISSFIEHNREANFLEADIISSQLDADRLDYLLRDSYFCGVKYGQYDINWLIRCVQKITQSKNVIRLGINKKGVAAIEHFLMARRLMTKNIYHHLKIKIAENILGKFLHESMEFCENTKLQKYSFPKNIIEFLSLTKKLHSSKLSESDFIGKAFKSYSTLTDFDIWNMIRTIAMSSSLKEKKICQLAERLFYRNLPKCYIINNENYEVISSSIKEEQKKLGAANAWKIGIENISVKTYKTDKDPILVHENDKIHGVDIHSKILSSLHNSEENYSYIWIDKEIYEKKSISKLLNNFRKKGLIKNESSADAQGIAAA